MLIYSHICVCILIYAHICSCMHIFAKGCSCVHICARTRVYADIFACKRVDGHICSYICIYVHIRTYMLMHGHMRSCVVYMHMHITCMLRFTDICPIHVHVRLHNCLYEHIRCLYAHVRSICVHTYVEREREKRGRYTSISVEHLGSRQIALIVKDCLPFSSVPYSMCGCLKQTLCNQKWKGSWS